MAGSRRARLTALVTTVVLAMIMTSGCWDRRELEDQAFILALGVDRAPGGTFEITARIAIPRNLVPGGGGGPGGDGGEGGKSSELITVRAPTLEGALNILGPMVGRRISLAHMTGVVVSQDLAREGLSPILQGLVRSREARGTMILDVARGTAREIMEKNRPPLDKNVLKYVFNVAETRRFNGLVPMTQLQFFLSDLQRLHSDPVLMMLAVNPKASEEGAGGEGGGTSPAPPEGGPGDEGSFRAGEMPRKGGNPVEYIGAAVFRSDRMVGILTGDETRILLAIRGEFGRSNFSIPDPKVKGRFVAVELRRGRRPQYRVSIQDDRVSIQESVFLEGDLLAVPSGIDYTGPEKKPELERQIEAHLNEQARALVEKAQKEFRADPFAFELAIRSKFNTWKEYEDFRWLSKFPDTDISVTFKVKLRRIGFQLAPATPTPR